MKLFDTNNSISELIKSVNQKDYPQRFCFMLFGMFLSSVSFNLFFQPYNIVTGGTSGLSLIARELFGIDPSLFIFIASIILIIIRIICNTTQIMYDNIVQWVNRYIKICPL